MRTLYCRHSLRVYRFILRMVRDAATAEDILSDVFCDIWQSAARFQGRSSISTWLLAIARNKAFSAMRGRQHVGLGNEHALSVPDPADTPDLVAEKNDRSRLIGQCLDDLSSSHREIIGLVYFSEKSVSEVAAIVNVPVATVKTRMFYARRKLAEALCDA